MSLLQFEGGVKEIAETFACSEGAAKYALNQGKTKQEQQEKEKEKEKLREFELKEFELKREVELRKVDAQKEV